MPGGRGSDRDRRRRGNSAASRQPERARQGRATAGRPSASSKATAKSSARPAKASAAQTTKRPTGQAAARARAKPSTGGAFKLSSTRRVAVLAMLVCAMALSVSVPLRTYLSQGHELAAQRAQQEELSRQVRELEHRKAALSDPARAEAEIRKRLGYVRPGETPYIVEVPEQPAPTPQPVPLNGQNVPWYEQLWESFSGKGS